MSGLSVIQMSYCEFGECEMISDVKLNCHPWERWANTKVVLAAMEMEVGETEND